MITCQAENVFGTRVAQVKLIVFGEFVFFFSHFQETIAKLLGYIAWAFSYIARSFIG